MVEQNFEVVDSKIIEESIGEDGVPYTIYEVTLEPEDETIIPYAATSMSAIRSSLNVGHTHFSGSIDMNNTYVRRLLGHTSGAIDLGSAGAPAWWGNSTHTPSYGSLGGGDFNTGVVNANRYSGTHTINKVAVATLQKVRWHLTDWGSADMHYNNWSLSIQNSGVDVWGISSNEDGRWFEYSPNIIMRNSYSSLDGGTMTLRVRFYTGEYGYRDNDVTHYTFAYQATSITAQILVVATTK